MIQQLIDDIDLALAPCCPGVGSLRSLLGQVMRRLQELLDR